MQPRQNWCWHGCTKATPFRASQQMGQLHSVSVAMFALRGGLGRAEDELRSCSPSLALALALPKGVARCKRQRGHGHSLSRGAEGRAGEEEMPRPLEKDTLPAPRAPSPAPRPPRGDVSPHSSPPLLQARPAVPGCPSQAGPGKHRGWLRDGHRELPTAAPKAPPSTGRSLAPPSRPRRHARQESRHEPGWPRLCRRPKISGEGREVTVHRSLTAQSSTR